MATKIQIFISWTKSHDQNLKNNISKGIFQWNFGQNRRIWLHLYIAEIKLENIILFQNGGQNIFVVLYSN